MPFSRADIHKLGELRFAATSNKKTKTINTNYFHMTKKLQKKRKIILKINKYMIH